MKSICLVVLMSFALVACGKSDQTKPHAQAQVNNPNRRVTPVDLVKLEKPSDLTLKCSTINFLSGGLDNTSGTKVIRFTKEEQKKEVILSRNSRVQLSVIRDGNQLTLKATGVKRDFVAGEITYGSSMSSAQLIPNNEAFEPGYSWVRCDTQLKEGPKPSQRLKLECSVANSGVTDDVVTVPVILSGSDNNKTTVVHHTSQNKYEVLSHMGAIYMKIVYKFQGSPAAKQVYSAGRIPWANNEVDLTLYEPRASNTARSSFNCKEVK